MNGWPSWSKLLSSGPKYRIETSDPRRDDGSSIPVALGQADAHGVALWITASHLSCSFRPSLTLASDSRYLSWYSYDSSCTAGSRRKSGCSARIFFQPIRGTLAGKSTLPGVRGSGNQLSGEPKAAGCRYSSTAFRG